MYKTNKTHKTLWQTGTLPKVPICTWRVRTVCSGFLYIKYLNKMLFIVVCRKTAWLGLEVWKWGQASTLDIYLLLESLSASCIPNITLSHIFHSLWLGKNREISGSRTRRREDEVWSAPWGSANPESDLSRPLLEPEALPRRFLCICVPCTREICPRWLQ